MEYTKALVEVDEILNYLVKDEYNKIPKKVINLIKKYKDKNYVWKFDETKELKEQDINKYTAIMLSYINMNYLLSDGQKEFMERIHEANNQNLQNNEEGTFEKNNTEEDNESLTPNMVVVNEKQSIFKRIFNKIKMLIKRKRKVNIHQEPKKEKKEKKEEIVIPPFNSKENL